MTTYGLDISHYQAGLDLGAAKRQGYEFVMVKCTEGTGYVDPSYAAFVHAARGAGMLVAAYHFLHAGNAAGQAALLAAHIGDRSIPVMIDCEPTTGSRPTVGDARAFRDECKRRGLRVTLLYLPGWYKSQVGRLDTLLSWRVVQSAYPSSAHAHGSRLYPGDRASGWNRIGARAPLLWQFASTGLIDGYGGNVDLDAYRGTRAQLAATALFKDYGHAAPKPSPRPVKPKPAPKWPSVDEQAATDIEGVIAGVKRPAVAARLRQIANRLNAGTEK